MKWVAAGLLLLAGSAGAQGVAAHDVYLAGWVPATADAMRAAHADLIVDAGGRGTHTTLQAAVDAVPAQDTKRWVIDIRPGTYREPLCIRDRAPLLLRGAGADAVRIVEGHWSGLAKAAGAAPHPCLPPNDTTTHGTGGSTSVAVFSDDVQLQQLTIANDAMEDEQRHQGHGATQAVALTTAGDRIQLDAVQLWGHHDTFYARRRQPAQPARVAVRDSLIAGDVDFVFGNATLVITRSTLLSRSRRVPSGIVLAPSTLPQVERGFLVSDSRFAAEPGLADGSVALGRAWDQGIVPGTWKAGASPNGQALVTRSELGAHIGPWAASTSRRPYSEAGNRLHESGNRRAPR